MNIDLKAVEKSFFQGNHKISVLKELKLAVEKAQTVAIIGESGSGKSTLLSLIAGLEKSSEGKVEVLGSDMGQLTEEELTLFRGQNMGIVFQNYYLVPYLTALENVQLPLDIVGKQEQHDKALALLEEVGLKDRHQHFAHELSGGESQRVALARALVHEPQLVLADEPSGNLDEGTGAQVMKLLFDLVKEKNMTLLLVTHNKELAQKCDKVYKLSNGQLDLI